MVNGLLIIRKKGRWKKSALDVLVPSWIYSNLTVNKKQRAIKMRTIIVGAGGIGKQLARVLCFRKNDVVMVDLNEEILEELKDRLDIMTVCGNGSTGRVLKKAGIEKASMLLAVTSNSEANILACSVAKRFEVPEKIARIRSNEYFDFSTGLTADFFGVDHGIIPEYECATDILDSLLRPAIKETVKFSHPDAQMVNFQIRPGSPMVGVSLNSFPKPELLNHLRICAILRYGQLIIPRGGNSFIAFDEIYVAGDQRNIDDLISWAEPEASIAAKVIIAGGTHLGGILASMLSTADIRVRMIESDSVNAERVADMVGNSELILQGESTDISLLEEAGIEHCDAFIATHLDDETNILCSLLAKNHGAKKVIATTNNIDYLGIISGMNMIDCCFSPLVSAVNILIKRIGSENRQTVAMLKRTSAEILEMTVDRNSSIARVKIKDIQFPAKMVFALIIRQDKLIPALGREEIQEGDHVIVMTESISIPIVEKMFLG